MLRDTQLESWLQVQDAISRKQAQVLFVIQQLKHVPGFKIAEILNIPTYTVLPRITELFNVGLVRDSGSREKNPETGRNVIVWEPSC